MTFCSPELWSCYRVPHSVIYSFFRSRFTSFRSRWNLIYTTRPSPLSSYDFDLINDMLFLWTRDLVTKFPSRWFIHLSDLESIRKLVFYSTVLFFFDRELVFCVFLMFYSPFDFNLQWSHLRSCSFLIAFFPHNGRFLALTWCFFHHKNVFFSRD